MRSIIVMFFFLGVALRGQAQEGVYINKGDTLRYNYTPIDPPQDTLRRRSVSKNNIFKRLVNYFEKSATDRTFEKKIDFTFAGGPSYSKNTSLGIGLLAAGLYRLDRTDSVTSPSDVSIFASVSISGFYALGVEGHNIFTQNRKKVDYIISFSSAPRDFWGIGYHNGRDNQATPYIEKRYLVRGRYLHQVLPNAFIGGMLAFEHTKGRRFKEESPAFLSIADQRAHYTATGIGAIIEYDSRDFIPNPYRGVYVSLQEVFFAKPLGNCSKSLWRTTFTAAFYQRAWKGSVIAADLYAEFNSDGTPWPMLARMGGSQRMRGYYQGQYTDNNLVTLQVELRQRIWRRIGCTAWIGGGNVFHSTKHFDWSETLPNYGVGLRWELKKRVNIRIDYGFGRKTSGFMLNINEAF